MTSSTNGVEKVKVKKPVEVLRLASLAQDTTRLAQSNGLPRASRSTQGESSGGGGGSRTRVRKHIIKKIYMRIRFWVLVSRVRKRPKPPDTRLGMSRL